LNMIFAQQWMVLGGDIFDIPSFSSIQNDYEKGEDITAIFFSFPGNPVNVTFSLFEAAVKYSKGDLIIENPYVLADGFWEILSNLPPDQARKIRIITCLKISDHPAVHPSFNVHAEKPHKKGVRFYDYSGCGEFSHWKIFAESDSKTIFHGSSNLNTRSERLDFELDLLIQSPVVFKELKQILQFDLNCSQPIEHFTGGNIAEKAFSEITVYFS